MSRKLQPLLAFVLLAAWSGSLLDAQVSKVATPSYDAVAIKPNKSGGNGTSIRTRDDTYQATNISLKSLLSNAYGIREGLISGLPGWAESARFDINAKIVDYDPATMKDLPREQRRAMLAAMLEKRFNVKVHVEVKQLPVYELVIAKDGPKFKENPVPPGPPDPGDARKPMGRGSMSVNGHDGSVEMIATGVPLANVIATLAGELDRNVIDNTGLKGDYDFHLKWTSERAQQAPAEDAAPLLFTAIQEQLGLKLVPAKGPVDTLVVDHVELPTEN